MLQKIIKILAGLVGILLLVTALRWQLDPAGVAAELGMPLLDGLGRSTQIGDLSAFFFVAGVFTLVGLGTRNATLLYTPAALIGGAAFFRALAWLLHDAALAPQIAMEVVMCIIVLLACRRLADPAP
jgi:hypothetical protein